MGGLDFRLLGPVEARSDDVVLDLGGPRQRTVLALLLLDANHVVSSDRLIEGVWGERPPASAASTLQSYVSRLRKTVGAEVLASRASGYELRVDPECVDLLRFARLAAGGRERLAGGDPHGAAETLREALGLWRGEPFGDLAYEGWASLEAERLSELRLAALEDRIDAELALGRDADLVGELELLVIRHPLRERPRGQLMLALYRAGRQAEALEAYQEARRTLVDDLGLDPGRALQELEQAILRHDPSLDVPAAAVEGERGSLVGREDELARLEGALSGAVAGRGGLAIVAGEPGIGKTRLAEELARAATRAGAAVLWGRCWEAGGAPPYWPWSQAMRQYLDHADRDRLRELLGERLPELGETLQDLRRAFPELGEPLPSDEFVAARRFELFGAAAAFVRLISAQQPLFVVFEDMHAADEPSLQLLHYLVPRLNELPILLAVTYRDTDIEAGTSLAELIGGLDRLAEPRLRLRGLSKTAVEQLVRTTTGAEPSEELVARLRRDTDGNPLFVEELTRMLVSENRLDSSAEGRLRLPAGVRDAIGKRLRGLSDPCREALVYASVIGREFDLPTLARAAPVDNVELLDSLDEAIRAGVLADFPDGLGRFRFAHALMRESVYDHLSPARRMRLHREVGEVLEDVYAEVIDAHLGELAHHFFEAAPAGEAAKAADYAERAARRALASLAFEEAARLFRLALRSLELTGGAPAARIAADLLGLGEAQARAGDLQNARSTFLRVAELARDANLAESFGLAVLGVGGRFAEGRQAEVVPLLEEALERVGTEDSPLRARLLARLAGALRDQPSREPRASISAEAVAVARRVGDPETLSYTLQGRFGAIWWAENAVERLEIADEVTELASHLRDRECAFAAHLDRATALHELGRVRDADSEFEFCRRIADELGQPVQQWIVFQNRALRAHSEGRLEDAEALSARAYVLGSESHGAEAVVCYRIQLFLVRSEQDRLAEIERDLASSTIEHANRWSLRCLLANLYAELGRKTEARRVLEELGGGDLSSLPHDQEWLFALSFLPPVCSAAEDNARAEELYGLLEPFADRISCGVDDGDTGSVGRPLGLLAAQLGRRAEAIAHLESAVEQNDSLGYRPAAAWSRLALGRLLGGERGRMLLDDALATAAELGLARLQRIASA